MDYTLSYVLAVLASVMTLFWTFLFLKYRKSYDDLIEAIDSTQYFCPEIFFIGFAIIDLFRINLRTERGRKKEKKISEIYGEKYAQFFHRCIVAGQITYTITILPFGLMFGAISRNYMMMLAVIAVTVVLVVYLDMDVNNAVERKRDEILSDYPEILSKLTLLVNAGMVIREAWKKVAYTSDRALYKEMQIASEEMANGVSELDAFHRFSARCAIKEIRKFASILSQNIQKGGAELTVSLRYMNEESWEEKKHRARRKGEAANSKLMLPLIIMFIGILMMVIIPVFASMF